MNPQPSALIAEDEPLLAQALAAALLVAWPGLRLAASVADGEAAVRESLRLLPDVLFLDIRMPGKSGLEAANALAKAWPSGRPFPALVFVTAYDRYAVEAFEAQAVDYLLKPLQPLRLQRTVLRLQQLLAQRQAFPEATLDQLRRLLEATPPKPPAPALLRFIPAAESGSQGALVRMVPVDDVLVLEAADKYVRVLTARHEYLVRLPLRELAQQLDPEVFWQIHRGALVRAGAIDTVARDESGRLHLRLRQREESWPVSRLHAQRFRAF